MPPVLRATRSAHPELPHCSTAHTALCPRCIRRPRCIRLAFFPDSSCPKPGVCVYECEAHTPEVPFGDCFVTRVRQVLASVPALEGQGNKEPACLFQASWAVEITRSTMMQGAIHRGARSGLQGNFMAYAGVLEQSFGVRLAGTEGTPAVAAATKKNLEPVAPIVRPIVRLAKMASAIFTARLLGQQAWQLKRKLVESHGIVQHDA